MSVLAISKETRDKTRAKADIDEERIKEGVKILKEWLETQPHLPHDYDEARLETLFLRCKGSIEKCKQTIDMYYTLRSALPEILCNRDPCDPWLKDVMSCWCYVALPGLTKDNERVVIVAYFNDDSSKRNAYDILKISFMTGEIRTIEDYSLADIYIFDCQNFTASDAVKWTLPVIKKGEVIFSRAFKARFKAAHIINAPPYVEYIVDLARSVLKPKLAARVHVHRRGSDSLLENIPARILPKEYGGEAGSLLDHWDMWKEKMESYRDWFLEQENVKVDESKRPDKSSNMSDLFGFEGTFRQLNVD